MDWLQVINGSAALAAFAASMYAYSRLAPGGPVARVAHLANGTLLLWYATINLTLGFGVWHADIKDLVPLFRWAFAPLLLTYVARQLSVTLWVRRGGGD